MNTVHKNMPPYNNQWRQDKHKWDNLAYPEIASPVKVLEDEYLHTLVAGM